MDSSEDRKMEDDDRLRALGVAKEDTGFPPADRGKEDDGRSAKLASAVDAWSAEPCTSLSASWNLNEKKTLRTERETGHLLFEKLKEIFIYFFGRLIFDPVSLAKSRQRGTGAGTLVNRETHFSLQTFRSCTDRIVISCNLQVSNAGQGRAVLSWGRALWIVAR